MKKIILFFLFSLLVTVSIFAEDMTGLKNLISAYPIFTAVVVIAHICLTFAVYKMKGGPWACFYFFLAPLVIILLLFVLNVGGTNVTKSDRKDIHHHFH